LKSIKSLDLDYLDLYLIHWPGTKGMKPEDSRHPERRKQSWAAMENLFTEGLKHMHIYYFTCVSVSELFDLYRDLNQCQKLCI